MSKACYEVEIQRSNISPKQFFSYCKREMQKRAGIDIEHWIDFDCWMQPIQEFDVSTKHEDWEEPAEEICRMKPFDWQLFLNKTYNFIMEFQFDEENKGFGYLYAVEFK